MRLDAERFLVLQDLFIRKKGPFFYRNSIELPTLLEMRAVFNTKDVATMTQRDASTVRWKKKKGSIFCYNGRYSLWEIRNAFPLKKRVNKKWSDTEIRELVESGMCKTRTKLACKTMMSNIRRGVYVIR